MRPSIRICSGRSVTRFSSPGVIRIDNAGLKRVYIFEKSGAARRTWQARLEEPADEFRLTVGSGFREYVLRVGARRRLGDFEPRGGGEQPVSGNDFGENA